MDTTRIAHPAPPTTRYHRVDYEFLGLLNEDFGIDFFSLNQAFMGVPPAPKKRAIALCEWAIRSAGGDEDEAGKALRAWAKKNRAGKYGAAFDPSCADCGSRDGTLYPVPGEHLTFFEGDELCGGCALNHGVL